MDLFFQNYYCVIPGHGMEFVVISRNACTQLKKAALASKGMMLFNSQAINDMIGYEENQFLRRVGSSGNNNNLRFAVWRDPISRLGSVYEWFVIEGNENFYFQMCDVYNMDFDRFLNFTEFELGKSCGSMMDEHLRPQSMYYGQDDVDCVVDINILDDWLSTHGIQMKGHQNASHSTLDMTTSQMERISNLYKEDYKIKSWTKYQS